MLYIIGLGLNEKSISLEGLEIVKRCKKVYLENYTVDFPYTIGSLKEVIDKKVLPVDRDFVESFGILDEAKKLDVALLVYGSPLIATTHTSLIQEARESEIKVKVIHSSSIIDALTETGLQIYKFGKITSIPKHDATSFLEVINDNKKTNTHTLVLIDIGLELEDVLEKLKNIKGKIILCQSLGTKRQRILYKKIEDLKNIDVVRPFCIIIPGKLHFMEKEFLERFS